MFRVRWNNFLCWSSPLNSHPMHFISMVERDLSKLLSDQELIDFFLNDSCIRDGLLESIHILSITPRLDWKNIFTAVEWKNNEVPAGVTSRLWGEPTCSSSWSIVAELTDWLTGADSRCWRQLFICKTAELNFYFWSCSLNIIGFAWPLLPDWNRKNVVIFKCWIGVTSGANLKILIIFHWMV